LEERKGSCERKVLAKVVRKLIDGIVCEAVTVAAGYCMLITCFVCKD
jgi:hypothetical protein